MPKARSRCAATGVVAATVCLQGCVGASRTVLVSEEIAFALLESAYMVALASVVFGLLVLAATVVLKRGWLFRVAGITSWANLVAAGVVVGALAAVWATGNDEFFGKVVVLSLATSLPSIGLWRVLARRSRQSPGPGPEAPTRGKP
jgi:hypothetical protein